MKYQGKNISNRLIILHWCFLLQEKMETVLFFYGAYSEVMYLFWITHAHTQTFSSFKWIFVCCLSSCPSVHD